LTALTQPTPEALRQAIRETKKRTSKPFGVNITLLPSINPPDYAGYARAAVEEGVRIFETAGNSRMFLCAIELAIQRRLILGQPAKSSSTSSNLDVLSFINALQFDMQRLQ
jgi:hypothetical protein